MRWLNGKRFSKTAPWLRKESSLSGSSKRLFERHPVRLAKTRPGFNYLRACELPPHLASSARMRARTKADIIADLLDPGLVAVVRARSAEQVVPLAQALLRGGIRAVEVTLTTPNALEAIREASRSLPAEALIGVGTVLEAKTCREAIEAGAQFVVSPITRPEIAREARAADKPVMLGAFTPTEAQAAHEAGADFVKLFPADVLGPAYIKAVRAPLPHLKFVPTGGVTLATIADFFKAGCPAVGIGSSLISAGILEKNDWGELERLATQFVQAAKAAR